MTCDAPECSARICVECYPKHVASVLGNGSLMVRNCFRITMDARHGEGSRCGGRYGHATVVSVLPTELTKRWDEAMLARPRAGINLCPYVSADGQRCAGGGWVSTQDGTVQVGTVQCELCLQFRCVECHKPCHPGTECKGAPNWPATSDPESREERINAGYVQCPNPGCRTHRTGWIHRVDGCNTMKCTQCNEFFCFLCTERLGYDSDIAHRHFRCHCSETVPCVSQRPDDGVPCKRCPTYGDFTSTPVMLDVLSTLFQDRHASGLMDARPGFLKGVPDELIRQFPDSRQAIGQAIEVAAGRTAGRTASRSAGGRPALRARMTVQPRAARMTIVVSSDSD